MRIPICVVLSLAVCCSVAAAAGTPPKFTKKPAAVRANGKVKISFAVDRETDVAVFIEDARGRVVRHLVAGVLGKNPPKPLKPGLAQSIEWDGKADYGRPAGPGPFRVRVALGLGAKFDKELIRDPQKLSLAGAVAAGPDGSVHVLTVFGAAVPNYYSKKLVTFDRAGKYKRTVCPPPSTVSREGWTALGATPVLLDGRHSPALLSLPGRRWTGLNIGRLKQTAMTTTPGGQILVLQGGAIGALNPDGTAAWGKYLGPKLVPGIEKLSSGLQAGMAVSADGKHVYVSGLASGTGRKATRFPAVYRAPLPARGPAKVFFGDPASPGKGNGQLAAGPRGLALDGKGHLLIADHANDRVVIVSEKTGKFAGSFAVKKPHHLAVDPKTGAVYVTSLSPGGRQARTVELLKFGGWKDSKLLVKHQQRNEGNPSYAWSMALDASSRPPVVWMGGAAGSLLRITDTGGKFKLEKVCSGYGYVCSGAFTALEVDRFRPDPEVYTRGGQRKWFRFNEVSGKLETLRTRNAGIIPGPGGKLYGYGWPAFIYQYDHELKPVAWKQAHEKPATYTKMKRTPNATWAHVPMTFIPHTLGVRHDGHLFLFDGTGPGSRGTKTLYEYLPSGGRKDKPIIGRCTDMVTGPRFDQEGNFYIADQIRPKDHVVPPEFAKLVGAVGPGKQVPAGAPASTCAIYGSIMKFGPQGGLFQGKGGKYCAYGFGPVKGVKLPAGAKIIECLYFKLHGHGLRRFGEVSVTGAKWMRMGMSHLATHYCNCETSRFDVDPFGRVWYPDLGRFRVVVLDTNGNEMTHFGGYGNADSAGPGSKFPKPEIAFSWLVGVGVTDKYAYMGDSMNERLLRAKLVYAAEATCRLDTKATVRKP